jgi:hypothetical protein
MKLLVITSIKEDEKTVGRILHDSGIAVFSMSETAGFKDHHTTNRLDNWFGNGSERFDSLVIFSFTDDDKALAAIAQIQAHNTGSNSGFPIRGFVMPVETSTHV